MSFRRRAVEHASAPSRALLATLLLALLVVPVASAQVGGRGGFEGQVVDAEGEPVGGLRLVAQPVEGTAGRSVTVKVNQQGHFESNFLPIGRYKLELKGDEYFLKSMDAVVLDQGGLEVMRYHRDAHPEMGLPSFQVSTNARPEITLVAVPAEERDRLQRQLAVGESREELEELARLYQAGESEALVREADAVLEDQPELAPALLFRGIGLSRLGRLEEAERSLRRSLELDPEQPNIRGLLGTLLVQRANALAESEPEVAESLFTEAASLLDAAMEEAEGAPAVQLMVNRAIAHDRSGTREKAIEAYEQLIETDPQRGTAYLRLADLYREAGREEDAVALLERAPAQEVPSASALYNVAVGHYNARDYDKALEVLQRAVGIDPDHAMVHRLMGRIYLAQNELDAARRELSKALALDPEYKGAAEDRQILDAMGGPLEAGS